MEELVLSSKVNKRLSYPTVVLNKVPVKIIETEK